MGFQKSTKSALETKKFALEFAKTLKPFKKGAFVISLKGNLGAGKTTFAQGFAKGLGIKEKILSPTFVILKFYKLQTKNYKLLYHIDCYRIKDEQDLLSLGWDKIVSDPQNIVLIEWPERVKKILPKNTISISFEVTKTRKHKITFS